MKPFATCFVALGLSLCSALAQADVAQHAADAERFLKLARADRLTLPVYAQVQQMFAQRFAEAGAPAEQQALLERYQAQANAELDRVIGWEQLKGDLIAVYTDTFSEEELRQLLAFYQSPVGQKVLQNMPQLTAESARLTQQRLEAAVPKVNQLLSELGSELDKRKKP